MRIEINAGGFGSGFAVSQYQSNFNEFIKKTDDVISEFKTVRKETGDLSGGVGKLQGAVDNISARIHKEENRKKAAEEINKKSNEFFDLAVRVDKQVATLVKKNKNEFYRVNPWLRPPLIGAGDEWYDKAWRWLCNTGKAIAEGTKKAIEWIKDTAVKIKDSIVKFCNEHKKEIGKILYKVGIALLTLGGAALAAAIGGPLAAALIFGIIGAIEAGGDNLIAQIEEKGSIDNVDWGEFGKETFVGGIIGFITGGLGGIIGDKVKYYMKLGPKFDAPKWIEKVIGIGSIASAETIGGMGARGFVSLIKTLFSEDQNFGDGKIRDDMFDPEEMFKDYVNGGIIEGFVPEPFTKKPTHKLPLVEPNSPNSVLNRYK